MRIVPTALFAGVASVAFAGTVAAHTLRVQLPDGASEQIHYVGDVAPTVTLTPATAAPAWAWGPDSPLGLMVRISAEMDREAAALINQMQDFALQPNPTANQPLEIDMNTLPRGAQSFSFVSTMSPSGACSQSMEIVSRGPGQKPEVIRRSSGNCGPNSSMAPHVIAAPDQSPGTAQPHARLYQANAMGSPAYRGMLHAANW